MPTPRHLVLTGVGFVGVATMATSSVSLYKLGVSMGIGDYLAAALPVALDVGAGVAALAWLTETGAARAWGRVTALCALIGSLIGNGLQHALTLGLIEPALPLVLAVGASIPAMLFAVIHLAALMAQPHQPTTSATSSATSEAPPAHQPAGDNLDTDRQEPAPATVIEHVTALVESPPARVLALAKPDTDLAQARRLIREGAGRPALCRELRIGDHSAKTLQRTNPDELTADTLAEFQAREAAAQERKRA
jgi:hypothetical protein